MKKIFIIIFISIYTIAQQKDFTIEDVVLNSYSKLAPSDLRAMQWMPTEAAYSFIEKDQDSFNLVKGFASSGKKENLISLEKLNSLMLKLELEGLSFFPQITWTDDNSFIFQNNNYLLKMSLKSEKLEIIL